MLEGIKDFQGWILLGKCVENVKNQIRNALKGKWIDNKCQMELNYLNFLKMEKKDEFWSFLNEFFGVLTVLMVAYKI